MHKVFDAPILARGISVKPLHSVGYVYRIDNGGRSSKLPEYNRIKGTISEKSQSRMKSAINWMVFMSENRKFYSKKLNSYFPMRINLITLTLSQKQMHTDTYILTHLLQPFLKWIERQGNDMYIWKAETQSNGNLHFHLVSNKYMHYQSIRNKWNSLQYKHGYLKDYFNVHGNSDANSTDVKGVKNIKAVSYYICKYMSKSGQNRRKVECKIWGCSRILSQVKLNFNEECKDFQSVVSLIEANSSSYQIEHFKIFQYNNIEAIKPMIDYFLST